MFPRPPIAAAVSRNQPGVRPERDHPPPGVRRSRPSAEPPLHWSRRSCSKDHAGTRPWNCPSGRSSSGHPPVAGAQCEEVPTASEEDCHGPLLSPLWLATHPRRPMCAVLTEYAGHERHRDDSPTNTGIIPSPTDSTAECPTSTGGRNCADSRTGEMAQSRDTGRADDGRSRLVVRGKCLIAHARGPGRCRAGDAGPRSVPA